MSVETTLKSEPFVDRARGASTAAHPVAEPRLRFEEVSHRYREGAVLDRVSFSVEAGEILCLLGPSGCGKTTLLRISAGVEQQSAGRVFLDGHEVAGPDTFVPAEARGLGLVFQDYALFPHLTVLDNVLFGADRRDRASALKLARETLGRMGISRYERTYPHALSGGEQQRVALVRALMPQPRVLLMDEPFSGLDRTLRDQVRTDTLALLKDTGSTAVIVTHDPEEAMLIGDRIALLRAGRMVQAGPPEALFRRPVDLEAARFFSELNEIETTVRGGLASTPLGPVEVRDAADGTRAVVAIRPHALRLSDVSGEGVGAVVVARRFLGEVERLDLRVEGLARALVVRVPAGTAPGGDEVRVRVAPDGFLAFPHP
ncbi:ABC transporter ATP-binding protein [Amorphus suaedae]